MNAKFLFLGVILFGASASVAQDARAILKRSYKKCQSIKNGHYEMTKFMKYMSEADTVKSTFSCDFKKLKKHFCKSKKNTHHYNRTNQGNKNSRSKNTFR